MTLKHGPKESLILNTEGNVVFRGPRPTVQEAYMKLAIYNRNHYQRLAHTLALKKPHWKAPSKLAVWQAVVDSLIETLKTENPYFNEPKFRQITNS